jgi:hypothetical protein
MKFWHAVCDKYINHNQKIVVLESEQNMKLWIIDLKGFSMFEININRWSFQGDVSVITGDERSLHACFKIILECSELMSIKSERARYVL